MLVALEGRPPSWTTYRRRCCSLSLCGPGHHDDGRSVRVDFLVERRLCLRLRGQPAVKSPSWQAVAKPIDREREIAALVKLLAAHLDAMPAKKRQAMIQKIALALRKD